MENPQELLQPIAEDDPGGPFLRFDASDDTYTSIEEARREDPDLFKEDRKVANYGEVVRVASEALRTRSKDIQVAAWLTEALLRREGIHGLRQGLDVMLGLLRDFWDHVNPPVEEEEDLAFRAAPLQWLAESLVLPLQMAPLNGAGHGLLDYQQSLDIPTQQQAQADDEANGRRKEAIEAEKVTPEQFGQGFASTPKAFYKQLVEDLTATWETIDELEEVGDDRFGAEAPSYRPLRRILEQLRIVGDELLEKKLEADPDPPEATATEAAATAPATEAAAETPPAEETPRTSASPGGISREPTSAEDAAQRVAAAARFLRAQDPANPAPYLLLRGFRWGEIRIGKEGSVDPRLLVAPDTAVRSRLKGLLLDARWADLLEQVEEVMATPFGRGWLDLQRYALTACDGLGGDYDVVGNAIKGALRTLLDDRPGLVDATLMDDSATANRETLQWLKTEGLVAGDAVEREEEERRSASGRDPFEVAMLRVRAGNTQEAIELLMEAVEQEKSERARFLRRSQAARIMVQSGHEAVALPILREMTEVIERHQLETWEGGRTVALPLALLWRCLDRLDDHSMDRQELYQRVCRLDPMQALAFGSDDSGAGAGPAEPPQVEDVTETTDPGEPDGQEV